LHVGEIAVEVQPKIAERDNKGEPVIELTARIFWAADEENQPFIDKEIKWVLFFSTKNNQTPRILKDIFRKAGFETGTWVARDFAKQPLEEGEVQFSKALIGAIKLLAVRKVPVLMKVNPSTRDGSTRNFLNPVKILRASPTTGEEYSDALPEVVTNAMVEEAFNAVLEGDTAESIV